MQQYAESEAFPQPEPREPSLNPGIYRGMLICSLNRGPQYGHTNVLIPVIGTPQEGVPLILGKPDSRIKGIGISFWKQNP